MKFNQQRRAILAASLFSLLVSTQVLAAGSHSTAKDVVSEREIPVGKPIKSSPAGTEHAPVDGKDGMPHDGPWIETGAERERQKTRDEPDDPETLGSFKAGLREQDIPRSNDAVMDDPARKAPKAGTRGTEGGVSSKTGTKSVEDDDEDEEDDDDEPIIKKPSSPKETPKLPNSAKTKTKDHDEDEDDSDTTEEKKPTLAKPTDLPEKPHSIPHPENPSSPKDHKIIKDTKQHSSHKSSAKEILDESAVIQPLHSLFLSFTMIIVSEIGDKTFLVACLMAMRHDRLVVFTAAFSALITMTVLSAVLGHAVPTLIPKSVTNFLAAGLFLIFGVKMLFEARKISPDEGVSEEMKEVEMELEEKEAQAAQLSRHRSRGRSDVSPYILESGRAGKMSPSHSPSSSVSSSRSASPSGRTTMQNITQGVNNLFSLLLSPAWVQTFVMTFLGEWGDRSQIATIAMAAGQDYWWVTAGALGGHAICTGMAVIGGKAIAGRVSLRTVTMGGAIAFLVFGVIYLLEAVY